MCLYLTFLRHSLLTFSFLFFFSASWDIELSAAPRRVIKYRRLANVFAIYLNRTVNVRKPEVVVKF